MYRKTEKAIKEALRKPEDKLRDAISHGPIAECERLLKKGVSPNIFHEDMPLLLYAIYRGSEEKVLLLLDAGAELDAKDKYGRTAMVYAAGRGYFSIAKKLLARGADIHAKTEAGESLMSHAFAHGQWDYCIELLEKKVDVDFFYHKGNDPLSRLCGVQNKHALLDKVLALPKINVNGGSTSPLYVAIKNTTPALDVLLADPRVDLDIKPADYEVPLHYALANGKADTVEKLLKKGANFRVANKDGLDVLSVIAGYKTVGLMRLVLEQFAKNPQEGDDARLGTALAVAAREGQLRIMEILVDAGADINFPDKDGKTALVHAVEKGKHSSVETIMNLGADQNLHDTRGLSARDYAGDKKDTKSLELMGFTPKTREDVMAAAAKDGVFVPHGKTTLEIKDSDDLSTIFNFATQQVIYRVGAVITTQNFRDVQGQEAIAQAHAQLRAMGGTPADLSHVAPAASKKLLLDA